MEEGKLELETKETNSLSKALQKLLENELLLQRVRVSLDCQPEEVPIALREVLRFLFLVKHYDLGQLTPSRRVDLIWHELILFTKMYREVCHEFLGKFVDHHPGGSVEKNRRQYQETLRCYRLKFGTPLATYWGREKVPADCGICEAF